jgi:membrane associated rhomboid family serine protease
MASPTETSAPDAVRCYRHPDRETLLSCSNCERPICTSCMTTAAVGVRCPECARGDRGSRASAPTPAARVRVARARGDLAIATTVLVVVNVLVFLVEMAQGVTVRGLGDAQVVQDGGLYAAAVADGEWYRMVTAGFLHAGLIHIAFNMWLLWVLGGALERYAGAGRMLVIYFASILWGSAGALLLNPDALTIGASGGVFGLMAALFLLERQKGVALLGSSVGALLVVNLVITFVLPGISVGGHIGGILGGAAAGFILSDFGKGHLAYSRMTLQAWALSAVLLVGAVVVGVAVS